jgi:hypothetical protein
MLVMLVACSSRDAKPEPNAQSGPAPANPKPSPRPPDELDERMRHCPLALDGATSTLGDIAGGVRFVVVVPGALLEEARRRARHVVDFAAKRTREGHGGFDGKGGGRMKNCPVVTDQVTITVADVAGGVQLDIVSQSGLVDQLRAESRQRARKFPFAGATIHVAGGP